MTLIPSYVAGLYDTEQETITTLSARLSVIQSRGQLRNAYYEGNMRIANMGISVPPALRGLKTVVGWPRLVVDALDERLDVEGFRVGSGVDTDEDLWEIWQANDLDLESQLGRLDALIYGSSFICVGTGDDPTMPLITVESPLEVACEYDPRTKSITSALRVWSEGSISIHQASYGTLYLPDETVSLARDNAVGAWQVVDRDVHNLGQVPVVRMANRARLSYKGREGYSEITPELVSIVDSACRKLLSLEVASEFYSAPQRYILGAQESDFQDAEGNPKTGWETYLGRFLALERDPDGNVPTVGQFQAYTPTVYTQVIDEYSKIVAAITGLPAEYLGITTSNPASADAIRMATDRLVTKAKRKQRAFECAYEEAMRLALLIRDGSIPDEAKQMETLWRDPSIPTPTATSLAITDQIKAGLLSASSDIALQHLGYTKVERQLIAAEREADAATQFLQELSQSLQAKAARADTSLDADLGVTGTKPVEVAPVTTSPPTPPATPNDNGN